jgi:hypothetical protein
MPNAQRWWMRLELEIEGFASYELVIIRCKFPAMSVYRGNTKLRDAQQHSIT